MSKDKTEVIRENTPTIIKQEIAKTCSCKNSRSPKCSIHGDPDKI